MLIITHKEREKERDRERERQTDRQTDRETERDRDRQTERQRDRELGEGDKLRMCLDVNYSNFHSATIFEYITTYRKIIISLKVQSLFFLYYS